MKQTLRKLCCTILICGSTMLMSGCCIQHDWQEATCTTPKTCSKCNATEGNALGHSWEDATCTIPKTCSICGETEGDPLGHTPGDWKITKEPTINQKGHQEKTCTTCGIVVEEKSNTKEIAFSSTKFNFSGLEIADYVDDHINNRYSILTSKTFPLGKLTVCGIYENTDIIGYLGFHEGSGGTVDALAIGAFDINDKDTAVAFAVHIASLIDPDLDTDKMIANLAILNRYSYNGLDYLYGTLEDTYPVVFIQPENSPKYYD